MDILSLKRRIRIVVITLTLLGSFIIFDYASAHRSGCHRWHSCPSDSGSYTCGDAGHPCLYPTYPKSGGVIYPPSGYYKDCYNCALKKVPENANTSASGIGFSCDSGYKKVGKVCKKVIAPKNAYVSGSTWYCNYGYRKVGNSCKAK